MSDTEDIITEIQEYIEKKLASLARPEYIEVMESISSYCETAASCAQDDEDKGR